MINLFHPLSKKKPIVSYKTPKFYYILLEKSQICLDFLLKSLLLLHHLVPNFPFYFYRLLFITITTISADLLVIFLFECSLNSLEFQDHISFNLHFIIWVGSLKLLYMDFL